MNDLFELHADHTTYTIVLKRNSSLANKILPLLLHDINFTEENHFLKKNTIEVSSPQSDTIPDERKASKFPDFPIPTTPNNWSLEISPQTIEEESIFRGEYEWVLLYGYILSINGKELFGKVDLKQLYKETNRLTKTRYKSFAPNLNICIKRNLFSIKEDGVFFITDEGKQHIEYKLKL